MIDVAYKLLFDVQIIVASTIIVVIVIIAYMLCLLVGH